MLRCCFPALLHDSAYSPSRAVWRPASKAWQNAPKHSLISIVLHAAISDRFEVRQTVTMRNPRAMDARCYNLFVDQTVPARRMRAVCDEYAISCTLRHQHPLPQTALTAHRLVICKHKPKRPTGDDHSLHQACHAHRPTRGNTEHRKPTANRCAHAQTQCCQGGPQHFVRTVLCAHETTTGTL